MPHSGGGMSGRSVALVLEAVVTRWLVIGLAGTAAAVMMGL